MTKFLIGFLYGTGVNVVTSNERNVQEEGVTQTSHAYVRAIVCSHYVGPILFESPCYR